MTCLGLALAKVFDMPARTGHAFIPSLPLAVDGKQPLTTNVSFALDAFVVRLCVRLNAARN